MRSKVSIWYECKVRYDKTLDSGFVKKVTELYTVEALTPTEAEARITEEMSAYIGDEFEITSITKAVYQEVAFTELPKCDYYYKVKLQFITIDEKTEQEKRTNSYYLVQADTLQHAIIWIDNVMNKASHTDYIFASIAETKIIDVYEHEKEKVAR